MPSDIEVLIVSYNSAAVLATCLSSLAAAAPGVAVAVREHGTDPRSLGHVAELLAGHPAPTRFEHDPSNPGFGAGCNALARGSNAEWLIFLNPDTSVVAWPWNAHAPPRQRILGATMVDSGEPGDHSGVAYGFYQEVARSWLRRRGPRPTGRGFVSGAALLIDAESFARLRGFDESYFMYYEDVDLCLRANAAGVETRVATDWKVRHSRAHSTRERFGDALVWSYESGCRFRAVHGTPLPAYRAYVAVDASGRAIVHALRRDGPARRAYAALTKRALVDLVRANRPDGRT